MRILIIGAGPTGLGAAWRLKEQGFTDFRVYDRNPYVGGLATSFRDEHGFLWDFAVHVAHSHYTYVDRLMEELLGDGFYHHVRKSWVREYGRFIPYPFQYNVRHLPGDMTWECVEGLVELENGGRSRPVHHFEDWILNTFGRGIAKHFMFPYNRKIWCVEPSEMGFQWIGDRVPTIDLERVLRGIALEQDDVSWGPNATFQFPKAGGTGAIWKALASRIGPETIRLSCELTALDVKARTATFADGTVEHYDYLISTMPLTRLAEMAGIDEIANRARQLKHTYVHVAGVATEFPMPEHLHDKTWIYCPESSCDFYRVTPFSNFSPDHVPHPERHASFLCEFSAPGGERVDVDTLAERALSGLRKTGLVDVERGNARVQVMRAEHGYPVPTLDRDPILDEVLPALEELHLFSRGRFGGWKYEVANMDHSVMQGVEVIDRILHHQPEVTLPTPHVANAGKR